MSLIVYLLILLIAEAYSMANQKFKFVVDKDPTYFVDLGARADIDCRTNVQNAKVTLWKIVPFQPTVKIVSSSDVIMNNGYFYIKNTFSGYFGKYQCRAEDALGNKITKTVQIVPDKSKNTLAINPDINHMTVLAGKSIKITCEALNPNQDLIKWEFTHISEKPQQYSVRQKRVRKYIKQSVLEVPRAKSSFTGSYECKRVTRFNTVLNKKYIYVEVIDPKAPTFRRPKHQVFTVAEGKQLNLPCSAIGFPTPTLTWEKDGSIITTCTKIYTHVCPNKPYLNTRRGLHIVSTSFKSDNGTFICKASNIAGVTIKKFDVIILAPPVVYFPKRQIVDGWRKPRKTNYPITCYASKGYPLPTFKWTMKLMMVNGYKTPYWMDVTKAPLHTISRAKNGLSSTLTVPYYISIALYKCTADNVLGISSAVVQFVRIQTDQSGREV